MKKLILVMFLSLLVGLLLSCASSPPANTLGTVEARFESPDLIMEVRTTNLVTAVAADAANLPANLRLNALARTALLEVAISNYGENVNVTRISWTLVGKNPITGLYIYDAKGFVVPDSGE